MNAQTPFQPHALHEQCWACGQGPDGLGLRFAPAGDGVRAVFDCPACYASYPGVVHGGIVATILDAAMTNCLLATGRVAMTADLHVRYRHPLKVATPATVTAVITRDASPLFVVTAEVEQDGEVKAVATAKFLQTGPSPSLHEAGQPTVLPRTRSHRR